MNKRVVPQSPIGIHHHHDHNNNNDDDDDEDEDEDDDDDNNNENKFFKSCVLIVAESMTQFDRI